MPQRDSNQKGNIAEAAVALHAVKLGIDVLTPLCEHGRYDLVFEIDRQLLRIQCKWAPRRGDVVVVNFVSSRYTAERQVRTVYSADEIDAVVAYCEELDRCYFLPIETVAEMRGMHLRLGPPRTVSGLG